MSTDEVEDKYLYKEIVRIVHKFFIFLKRIETKIKGDYVLVLQVPFSSKCTKNNSL